QGLSYMVAVLVRIRSYEREIKNVFSSIENIRLRWLRNITLLAATAWCSFLIEHTLFSLGINVSSFMISSILIAMYLFTLGYLGMLKSEVLEVSLPESVPEITPLKSVPEVTPPESAIEEPPAEEKEQDVAAGDGSSKYEKSGLSEEAAQHYKKMILEVMEREKPYRTSDLTLPQLAELVRISPHNLSEVINSQLGKTFYDLINESRIGEVKKALADPARKNLKIISIAFDAGFNSKASFNSLFKQHTRTTPSEFRRQALEYHHTGV
ncbi:MAG TPA: helix-turn-helix domain-containing protein, partial [Bacteroidota bacterium]|nr:helix-turn-helix domain-containing protein [Bacteroidota bacterium]